MWPARCSQGRQAATERPQYGTETDNPARRRALVGRDGVISNINDYERGDPSTARPGIADDRRADDDVRKYLVHLSLSLSLSLSRLAACPV